MRILVISNLYPPDVIGGYELGCAAAVEALRRREHDVRVLTSVPRHPTPPAEHVHRNLRLADVFDGQYLGTFAPVTRSLMYAQSNFLSGFNVHRLLELMDDFRPDVVYLWNLLGVGGLGLAACSSYTGTPWVWHLMDSVPSTLCSINGKVVPAVAREFGRHLAGHYLACSTRVVDEIASAGIDLRDSVRLIPNWITGSQESDETSTFSGEHLRIVSAGQIGTHKGIDILIEAAALLRRHGYANFTVDLYGRVTDERLQRLVHDYALGDRVCFKGFASSSDLVSIYRNYDVFAFPTWRREPFGFAPLEAAAQGCLPVISADCGIAEWLVDGVHCIKARRTAQSFARHFRSVLDGHVDVSSLATRAREAIWRDFHLDTIVEHIERALQDATEQRSPRTGSCSDAYRLALIGEKVLLSSLQEQH